MEQKNSLNLLFLLLAFGWVSCQKTSLNTSISKPDGVSILALGDSYTIGQSVPSAQRWPTQLADSLKSKGILVDTVVYVARTGWTTQNLQQSIATAQLRDTFDFVTLSIGVNNQYQRQPMQIYEPEFDSLLRTAIRLARGRAERVMVVSIPDYGYTPFGWSNRYAIGAELDQYNAINLRLARQRGTRYADITPLSRVSDYTLIATDGLHPSGEAYRRWVKSFQNSVVVWLR